MILHILTLLTVFKFTLNCKMNGGINGICVNTTDIAEFLTICSPYIGDVVCVPDYYV